MLPKDNNSEKKRREDYGKKREKTYTSCMKTSTEEKYTYVRSSKKKNFFCNSLSCSFIWYSLMNILVPATNMYLLVRVRAYMQKFPLQ